MPVTVRPSPQLQGQNKDHTVYSSSELLKVTSKAWCIENADESTTTNKLVGPDTRKILQSSFPDVSPGAPGIIPYGNGFVKGILRAFQQDLHLVLRPDDVWLALINQFSMYVNGNAELLRSQFVAHEGQKQLKINVTPLTMDDIPVGKIAQLMTHAIENEVIDPDLRTWMLPNFSTTTDHDMSVASVSMMAACQKYFEYVVVWGCGFPSVTLLGEKADWEELGRKVERFPIYGQEPKEWTTLLTPIIQRMTATFDYPEAQEIKEFWLTPCYQAGSAGSGFGVEVLSGWLTAFCFWDEDGKRTQSYSDQDLLQRGADRMHDVEFKRLVIDGVTYPLISPQSIPKGVVTVPLIIEDIETGLVSETTIVAGQVGMTATPVGSNGEFTKVQIASGWWLLFDKIRGKFTL